MAEETTFERTRREAVAHARTAAKKQAALWELQRKLFRDKEEVTIAEAAREASAILARSPELIEAAEPEPDHFLELPAREGVHDLPRLEHGPGPRVVAGRQSQLQLMLHYRGKGRSLRAIALKAGCSLGTVQRRLAEEQHRLRERGVTETPEAWDEYCASLMYGDGDTPWPPETVAGLDGKRYPGHRRVAPKRDQK
ncbi:MAG TPA: hypothetical protein VMV12_01840 [Candidatus Micrarchaeaceae archaeon]|nr:hypothetical protein [Candidatus Micrarchaeaceae archaeon]